MKKFLIIVGVLILILGGGYLLLKNGKQRISQLAFKQIDLGIDESSDIIYEYYEEIEFENGLAGEEPKSGELVFEGGIEVDKTFTQEEINSWFSAWEESWTGTPFQNLQVKLHEDGSIEASSLISIQEAESIGKTLGYTDEQIESAKKVLKFVPDPLPMYGKGNVSITDNVVDIDFSTLKVANFSLPGELPQQVTSVIGDMVEQARYMSDDTDIQSAIVTSEGVKVSGTVPASVGIREE
jgi:hypothetical protein